MFAVGDTVYVAQVHKESIPLPCQDCLGTKTWTVTTPAGDEFECDCLRCAGYGCTPPSKTMWRGEVTRLTVGSVRTDTAAVPGKEVSYMCRKTGVGSGTVYYEMDVFATRQAAQECADQRAAKHNEERRTAKAIRRETRLAQYNLRDLVSKKEKALRLDHQIRLQDVQSVVFPDEGAVMSSDEKIERIREIVEEIILTP